MFVLVWNNCDNTTYPPSVDERPKNRWQRPTESSSNKDYMLSKMHEILTENPRFYNYRN